MVLLNQRSNIDFSSRADNLSQGIYFVLGDSVVFSLQLSMILCDSHCVQASRIHRLAICLNLSVLRIVQLHIAKRLFERCLEQNVQSSIRVLL